MLKYSKAGLLVYGALCLGVIGFLLMPHLVVKYDGAAHIAVYALLTFWPVMVIGSLRKAVMIALGMVLVGGIIEFLQRYSPERTASWMDFGMNTVGVMLGFMIGALVRQKFRGSQA